MCQTLWHVIGLQAQQDEYIKFTISKKKRSGGGGGGSVHSDPLLLNRRKVLSAAQLQPGSTDLPAASYLNLLAMWQKAESPLKWFGRLLSSVLLSILYGYPWPPKTSTASGLTFFNVEQLIRLGTTSCQDNTKSQKSQRKKKKGEGGYIVNSQAAIGVS